MRKEILSERPNLFEPDAYIGFVLKLTGNLSNEQVRTAVLTAYQANETTMSRIVLAADGHAFYEKMEQSGCTVTLACDSYEKLMTESKKIPFRLKEGELVRTFIIPKNREITLLIMAHHLAGDGKAVEKFAEEVLEILDGKVVPYRSVVLLSKEDFKQRGSLPDICKSWIRQMNEKWDRKGSVFSWEDYERLHQIYWNSHSESLQVKWMDPKELSEVKENAKSAGVSVNSWLVANIRQSFPRVKIIGIPVSVRDSECSMNNMTSGIRIIHAGRPHKTLAWNAKQIHKKIRKKLSNCHVKYTALSFVSEVSGSLVDGVLMQEHQLYDNPITRKMSEIMGYSGKRKTQLGITNLGVAAISEHHKEYRVEEVLFIPPKVSYADRIIGVVTFRNRMCILEVESERL